MIQATTMKDGKPPYWLGFLGIIPLLGAIVGFVMIILGAVKYRSRLMIGIGVLAVLFTVGVYSYLFYYVMRSPELKQAQMVMAKQQLNALVKEIEWYKMEKQQYPDSLPQLIREGQPILIEDQVQALHFRPNRYFNYQRKENRYLLFSSGDDGIPFTHDDIYPGLALIDSGKTGLIILKEK